MKTVDDVLLLHAGAPVDASIELVRRFKGAELRAAADAWCARFSSEAPRLSRFDVLDRAGRHEAFYVLVELATSDQEPLHSWVLRARTTEESGGTKGAASYDTAVLSAVLFLWPHRARVGAFDGLLKEWAAGQDDWEVADVARALWDYPDLAFGMLGPPMYRAPPEGWCYGCGQHPRKLLDTCAPHVDVVRRRRQAKLRTPQDDAVLEAIPGVALVRDPILVSRMVRWLWDGIEVPQPLWSAAEVSLTGSWEDWSGAVRLMCASFAHRDRAVHLLATATSMTPDPTAALSGVSNARRDRGVFVGPGWGRDARARRLAPLSRALLERGVWPTKTWLLSLEDDDHAHETSREEHAHEWVREILADGLLAIARDVGASLTSRFRALDALERLMPGGHGGVAKALSSIESPPELQERARAVQRAFRAQRDGTLDAELAVADACEIFFASAHGEGGAT